MRLLKIVSNLFLRVRQLHLRSYNRRPILFYMTKDTFVWWIWGFFEIAKPKTISADQLQEIRNHLDLVMWRAATGHPTTEKTATYCQKSSNSVPAVDDVSGRYPSISFMAWTVNTGVTNSIFVNQFQNGSLSSADGREVIKTDHGWGDQQYYYINNGTAPSGVLVSEKHGMPPAKTFDIPISC